MATSEFYPASKVYYRPLEAAIRWCGLEQHEEDIRCRMQGKRLPEPSDFPEWPTLRLNTERIYDAIANRELRCGIDGITVQGGFNLDHPQLTIRHVDLRGWMIRFYPDQRPRFLFGAVEQQASALALETLNALTLERDALKAAMDRRDKELQHYKSLLEARGAETQQGANNEAVSSRGETTNLHIIGGLLRLFLGKSPSGQPYSSFKTQESIVSALIAHFGQRMGFTERTLHGKFAAANRKLGEP